MKCFLVLLALLSGNAFAQWGAIANSYNAMQEGKDRELLRQCMSSCNQGDGLCYQGCNSAYGQKPQQQQQSTQTVEARFTGVQQSGHSVTGQRILQCQYGYFGSNFWRNYRSDDVLVCPLTVQVQ